MNIYKKPILTIHGKEGIIINSQQTALGFETNFCLLVQDLNKKIFNYLPGVKGN